MKLTSKNIDTIIKACLLTDTEFEAIGGSIDINNLPSHLVAPTRIVHQFCFIRHRIDENKRNILTMLLQLNPTFFASQGGGWSFLNACEDAIGNHWGEHRDIEALLAIGEAAGFVSFPLPREAWNVLPGGMPYFTVKDMP